MFLGLARRTPAKTGLVIVALLGGGCSVPIRKAERAPGPTPSASATAPLLAEVAKVAAPHPPEPGGADLDPSNDGIVAPPDPVADCATLLARARVQAAPSVLPVHKEKSGRITCGAEQVFVYQAGPESIRYNIAPVVTCGMALALAKLETILQKEALATFNARVVRIDQAGTYSCRKMARFRSMVSEHSYANAIDIRGVALDDGRRISVKSHFGSTETEPAAAESQFLRAVARRLYDEAVFSVVLTAFFDVAHRDHLHLDLARYRVDGTR
jgi:hypothetical protein